MTTIFAPFKMANLTLENRLVMAPMTRSRALPDGTPGVTAAEYYSQRASIGLIITEGTQPSDDGQGYMATPGVYTDAHVEGWKKITTAVHEKNGKVSGESLLKERDFNLKKMMKRINNFDFSDPELHANIGNFVIEFRKAIKASKIAPEIKSMLKGA